MRNTQELSVNISKETPKLKHRQKSFKNTKFFKYNNQEANLPKSAQLKKPQRESSVENEEVNRIFGVLQRNLNLSPGQKLAFPNTILGEDPKRTKVRQLLQKHFEMKEDELRQSYDTLNLANDTMVIRVNKEKPRESHNNISKLLYNLEEINSKCSNSERYGDSKILQCQPSKGETLQFLPAEDYIANDEYLEPAQEISMQFQNISRISDSSSTVGEDEQKDEDVQKAICEIPTVPKYFKQDNSELSQQKLRIMFCLMQVYCMMKTKNPFDFNCILRLWSSLQA